MTVVGMVRVRNGALHIINCLQSMLRVCDSVVVMDDHSSDRTPELLDKSRTEWFKSPFQGLNEARDRQALFYAAIKGEADWVLAMDADEVLLDPEQLRHCMESGYSYALAMRIITLWDRPDQIRVDGVYGDLWRPYAFRPSASNGIWVQQSPEGPNLHCGSVPTDLLHIANRCDARVLHYGYMLRDDRLAKYKWYLDHDTQNLANEDYYRHAVQGDLPEFPAHEIYKHGGPLKLEEWHV